MDKALNSYILVISFLLIDIFVLAIINSYYNPEWNTNTKIVLGFIGIGILLFTLINFPVGYLFKDKVVLKNFNVTIIFYGVILTGIILGFGIVRIILINN